MEIENIGHVIYNGELVDANTPVIEVSNRSFRYGDGLFESIRIINGRPCFLENHYSRLVAGMDALKIKRPVVFSIEYFERHLMTLIDRNEVHEGGFARLIVFRNPGGTYRPESNGASFVLTAEGGYSNRFELNEEGLSIAVYDEILKPINKLGVFKTSSALLYVMASLYAQENELDEVLILNEKRTIIEGSATNIFIASNGVLYTPTLEDGCVGGTMRMQVINLALQANIKVYECSLTQQNVLAADEIFLTNASKGIQWVGSFKSKRYYNTVAKSLVDLLNLSVTNSVKDLQENA